MKLIRKISDLNKAIEDIKQLGFVPTMGGLHKGHESLIKASKKNCKKTLVSIFVNPRQFNNRNDYKTYPRSTNKDLKILNKLKVDYVFLPTEAQIYKDKKSSKIILKKSQKILCAKFRKGHFEGVISILDHFVKLISPNIMFLGEKDYQQYFLVKNYIEKNYSTKIFLCKTFRSPNKVAFSTRNKFLTKKSIKICSDISKQLLKLKSKIYINSNNINNLIKVLKKKLINEFNIEIEYLEFRNLLNFSKKITNRNYKIFICYYLDKVRIIDNF